MTDRLLAAAIPRLDGSAGDGVHLMWTAPANAGWSVDGWDVQRRTSTERPRPRCTTLTLEQLGVLHRVLRLHLPIADLSLRESSPSGPPTGTAPVPGRSTYDVTFAGGHDIVEIRAGVPAALVIAFRAGKAVAAREATATAGAVSTRFDDLDVDRVSLVVTSLVTSLRICVDDRPDPAAEEAEWAPVPFIARGIQVPIRSLDPSLSSPADEEALARTRLLPGEDLDRDAFATVAEVMNEAADGHEHTAPVWMGTVTRDDPADPFLEVRSWSYALAVLVEPAWRRALGFGYSDGKAGLVPGTAYDYRISGRCRRRDIDERVHGFHAVPRSCALPTSFALGPIWLSTPEPTVVEQRRGPGVATLLSTGRKGIALSGDPCLTLSFPTPVSRVVLELEPGAALKWRASTTEFLPGLAFNSFSEALPPERRVTIETTDPVDTIELAGSGFLYAVREIDPAHDPDELVTCSAVLHGVVFDDTPLAAPPLAVETTNLQPTTTPAATTPPRPASPLGFRVGWTPAPASGNAVVAWPDDVAAVPPMDALAFHIERRRVDAPGDFEVVDDRAHGSRGAVADPPALHLGADLEAVYPERAAPTGPLPASMAMDDLMVEPGQLPPSPGSTHQYRISTIDALGRRSASATAGPIVRLEKHEPPPQPASVRARVLQAADPDLPADDRALLGASSNATVLEWGWTARERTADPHATEFRVYWEPLPPDVVAGEASGVPTLVGGLFEMSATLDRPVPADAMRDRYLRLPDHPFRVVGHGAGDAVVLRLEPSALDPAAAPGPARFVFRPVQDGSELRPSSWAERTAVVPITAAESYRHVLRDRLTLDAGHALARAWVGVTAADDQGYVPDHRPAASTNGGRPGNESAVVALPVEARYLGQPTFEVPPPLPDVPEVVTDEPGADSVIVTVDPPGLLPPGAVPGGHRLQLDRLGLDLVVAAMSARADDTIGFDLPGTATSYTLANPDDQAALLAQIRSATPARVEGRFLVDAVLRFADQLDPLWISTSAEPLAPGATIDRLPAKAERYVHRVRLVDAAGHVSARAALLPQIVRVASLRSPSPPAVRTIAADPGELSLQIRVRDAFDLAHVVLFAHVEDGAAPADAAILSGAQLLRTPNRRDLYPTDGIRVRLSDGSLLAPSVAVDIAGGTFEPPDRLLTATLAPGSGRRVALWAVTLSRDGIPSRLTGPLAALTKVVAT